MKRKAVLIDPQNYQELTTRYEEYLEEIVDRLWVVVNLSSKLLSGQISNEYRNVDIELCYLQVRKSFECTMFAALLAHRLIDRGIPKKLEKEYHAGNIAKYVKRKNPSYFPRPVRPRVDARGVVHLEDLVEHDGVQPLTESEFLQIYSQACGTKLHSDHAYDRDLATHFEGEALELNRIALRTLVLIGTHTVELGAQKILASVSGKDSRSRAQVISPIHGL